MIEDTRKERGDYDDFFRIAKPSHDGSLEERITRLEHQLPEYRHLLDVLTRALLDKGVLTAEISRAAARLPRRPRRLARCPNRCPRLGRPRL